MPRILWFKDVSRWTRRGIPLKVVWVSPRQISIIFSAFVVGLVLSMPLQAQLGKLITIGSFLTLGFSVSFWPVRMLSPEQMVMLRLRGLTRIPRQGKTAGKDKFGHVVEKPEESAFEIESDSAESFTPLSITGRWKRTKLPRRVSLYVDGVPRVGAEALATPVSNSESGYTIVFLPTASDIGLRELEVRIEGEEKPIYRKKVEVKVRGARSLEMKKVS